MQPRSAASVGDGLVLGMYLFACEHAICDRIAPGCSLQLQFREQSRNLFVAGSRLPFFFAFLMIVNAVGVLFLQPHLANLQREF